MTATIKFSKSLLNAIKNTPLAMRKFHQTFVILEREELDEHTDLLTMESDLFETGDEELVMISQNSYNALKNGNPYYFTAY